jgi:hypothetical protein
MGAGGVATAFVIAGYAGLIAFALANYRLIGMVLIAMGLAANLTVIAVDGGMPVRGVPQGYDLGPRHHPERPGDQLTGLADVVHVGVIGETVSAGDIVLSVGSAAVVWGLLAPGRGRRSLRRRLGGRASSSSEPIPSRQDRSVSVPAP